MSNAQKEAGSLCQGRHWVSNLSADSSCLVAQSPFTSLAPSRSWRNAVWTAPLTMGILKHTSSLNLPRRVAQRAPSQSSFLSRNDAFQHLTALDVFAHGGFTKQVHLNMGPPYPLLPSGAPFFLFLGKGSPLNSRLPFFAMATGHLSI